MRRVLMFGMVSFVAACANMSDPASDPSSNLPPVSNSAQAVLPGGAHLVSTALIDEMTERQFIMTEATDDYMAFDRPVDNAALWPGLGGSPDTLPRARVTFKITPRGAQTEVDADLVLMAAGTAEVSRFADATALGIDGRIADILDGAKQTVVASLNAPGAHMALAIAPSSTD